MKMTPALLIIGSLLVFWSSVFVAVFLPAVTMQEPPSDTWRVWTAQEDAGHKLYVANGCSYCHSLFVRTTDWDLGAERIADRGDYAGQTPAILGTERTGPDLSQAGGEHPDDWHVAHFTNPRYTRPLSLMPSWEFLGSNRIAALTAFVQAQGGKAADVRTARQKHWREPALEALARGPDANVEWLHANVPAVWRAMPNPYPATGVDLERGRRSYQQFCINCHGPVGDGQGPAVKYLTPPPLNFTTLRRHLIEGKYIGGIFYYQVMNGITGTGMPYFKRELESEKIWDVSNYLAVEFLGYTDAGLEPRGIPAAYEPAWTNTFQAPARQGTGQVSRGHNL
jgi:cytochrome c oxidase cbb3-type subunit II